MSSDRELYAKELRSAMGDRVLTPVEMHEVQCDQARDMAKYDQDVAEANNYLLQIRRERAEGHVHSAVSDSASSIDNRMVSPTPARPGVKLLHVVQRLPEGATIFDAHKAGQKILSVSGVKPGGRYYLEQDGETASAAGRFIHLHLSLYFKGYKSLLAQRIVRFKLASPNMTQVFAHDSLGALTRYLDGYKSLDKARKVATDHIWREHNGLKHYYTRSDAADLGLDHHGETRV